MIKVSGASKAAWPLATAHRRRGSAKNRTPEASRGRRPSPPMARPPRLADRLSCRISPAAYGPVTDSPILAGIVNKLPFNCIAQGER